MSIRPLSGANREYIAVITKMSIRLLPESYMDFYSGLYSASILVLYVLSYTVLTGTYRNGQAYIVGLCYFSGDNIRTDRTWIDVHFDFKENYTDKRPIQFLTRTYPGSIGSYLAL